MGSEMCIRDREERVRERVFGGKKRKGKRKSIALVEGKSFRLRSRQNERQVIKSREIDGINPQRI